MDPIQNNFLVNNGLAPARQPPPRQPAFGPLVEALGRDIERNGGADFLRFLPPLNAMVQPPPPIELPPLPANPFGRENDANPIFNFRGLDGLRLNGVAGIDELYGLDKELAEMDVPLGRMLTWEDIDGYHLHKFITGRTFKNRSYYNSMLEEFYRRIFYAYPEELREGRAEYNPNIHETETMLYEGQLRRLEELLEEERMERAQEYRREEQREFIIM